MHLSLARKYRPKRFADVAVQSHVSTTLRGAIARGRVAHGYLLCGPRGTGKTTLARVLAMALNCDRNGVAAREAGLGDDSGEPCGECESCRRIWSGSASLDVVEIDAASNRGVDDARDLRERAMYASSAEGRFKVYIVDEAHMLTREAWNALLKVLEEPPPRVVFVFATTEPQKIAQAAAPVLSRLQRFDLKRIGAAEVRARLGEVLEAEGVGAEPDALALLARAADGSLRDALSLTDQVLALGDGGIDAQRVRDALGLVPEDEFVAMMDRIAGRRAAEIFPAVARLADAGVDLGGFVSGFAEMLRALLAVSLGGDAPEMSETGRELLAARRELFTPADLLRMLTSITELEPRFRRSGQQQLLLETLLVRFAMLDRTVSIEEVLRGLGNGGSGSGAERSGPTPPSRPQGGASGPPAGAPGVSPTRRPAASADAPAGGGSPSRPRAESAGAPSALAGERSFGGGGGGVAAPPRPATQPQAVAPPEPAAASRNGNGAAADLAHLVKRWDDIISDLRAGERRLIASALERARPVTFSAKGEVTVELTDADPHEREIYEKALTGSAAEVLAAIGRAVGAASRLVIRGPATAAPATPPRRLTEEAVKGERMAMLRRRDPLLDAAVDALDLELLD